MKKIKVRSTYYPQQKLSKDEWMKEFNVGRLFLDLPNGHGFTYGEYILEMKKDMDRRRSSNLVGTNS